jgi:hypothetical protein
MYIDRNTKQGNMLGKYYILKKELKTLCCSKVFKVGDIVLVRLYSSKNRLLIIDMSTSHKSIHKIKRSSLNRVAEEYKDCMEY